IPVQLDVYDLPMTNNELKQLVSAEKFTGYHSIIGPFRSEKVQLVAKTLKSDRIPIISPLTKSDVRLYRNLFQSRPDENILEDLMLSYLNELNEQHQITLLDDTFNKAEIALLTGKIPSINRISLNASGVIPTEAIDRVLSPTTVNTFVLSINDIPILNSVLRHLTGKLKTHQIQIVVLSPGKVYEDESIKPETLGKLHYTYPSISKEIVESDPFVKNFQKTYQLIPNAYTVRGFDIMYDVLLRLSQGINIYDSLEKDYTTEYAASRFRYQKKFLEGYTNTAAYILQYQPDLSVKVLNP
ncbi:MAG: hypothetical protein RQ756_01465, partial [Flavobacteriaceae bacterium]|nr:hypothetical protein [Flavobacteriaceae bacterium]